MTITIRYIFNLVFTLSFCLVQLNVLQLFCGDLLFKLGNEVPALLVMFDLIQLSLEVKCTNEKSGM